MQARLNRILDSRLFQGFIITMIIIAGILVGLSTFPSIEARFGSLIETLDWVILGIFTIEIGIKMAALWPRPHKFFADGWNVFDFVIVAVCFLPIGGSYVAVLRLFRLLRVLRLVTMIPRLQVLVTCMLKSLPSMGYVTILLFLLFYIYAVMGTLLFGKNDPVHFGNLWVSLLSLFRAVTLEDWTDLMYIQMFGSDQYEGFNQALVGAEPRAMPILGAFYFVSFVLIGTIIMLNLVIGVIINGMDEAQREVADRAIHEALTHENEGIASAAAKEKELNELKRKLLEVTEALDRLK